MPISDKVYNACTSNDSVSSSLAQHPTEPVHKLAEKLYGSSNFHLVEHKPPTDQTPATQEELERAKQCGRFGDSDPSELFLRAFHDVLGCLEPDLLHGSVSPSLIGTTGYVPLTVIGPLIDVTRHMSNLIVSAKKEVLLATNYWMASKASTLITDALRELSRRAGERGEKIPVKIMYDRGNVKQLLDPHQTVKPDTYSGGSIQIPRPEEIPNLDLHVVNFHRPLLGTFHAKFMVVDREVAITQSNNIQDNDNTEMMTQLEGPIVDSLWDTFVISWHNVISPLGCTSSHATPKPVRTFSDPSFTSLFDSDRQWHALKEPPAPLTSALLPEHLPGAPQYDATIASEIERMRHSLLPTANETQAHAIARHLNYATSLKLTPTAPPPEADSPYHPLIPLAPHGPIPMALVNRKPFGSPSHTSLHVPQNTAFLSLIANAQHTVFIQTPDLNATPLLPALRAACLRGVEVTYYVCLGYNDAGELLPGQGGTNEMVAHALKGELETVGGPAAAARLRVHYYVGKDQVTPLHNSRKLRSCHIKLLIVDGQVAVQGSGNQDTQSWWQSQEVNVMIDSQEVCAAWRAAIERNQGTARYGEAGDDGVWRDEQGNEAEGATGVDPGRFSWAKGVVGAVQRVRGLGGF